MAKKAKKTENAKKGAAGLAATGKKPKGTIEIFDPFGPGFRVIHRRGRTEEHIGGAAARVASEPAPKLVLEIFDPFGPGFRVVRKKRG